jgi:histidyl-tRNA synthetase
LLKMNLSTQPYKGARDFYPADKRAQKYMFGVLRRVVESFGYQEYDAPIVEPIELYLSKTSQEIVVEQTYNFVDRGGRHVTLRPEMTPTVSRMVAGHRQELAYPVRWYSIPNLWRYERPQAGRLREHWQLNVDIFGVPGIEADHEIILIADSILQAYGAKRDSYEIRISSRVLINWLMLDYFRLSADEAMALMRLIDRYNKLSEEDFVKFVGAILSDTQKEAGLVNQILELLKTKKVTELPAAAQQHPAVAELIRVMETLEKNGVSNAIFDASIMRGFDYYTNIVFEVFDKHPDNNRSMFGGGRYDGLVGAFGVEPVPTVGFGMGDVTLLNFLKVHELLPELPMETDAAVLLIGPIYEEAQKVLVDFRKEGVRLAVDSTGRKLDAQIKSAVKAGYQYAILIGEKELESKRFTLKDLKAGKEHEHSFERIVSTLAARHKKSEELV